MDARLITLTPHTDERGTLVALEELAEVPFLIRRVFYIYDVPLSAKRGGHANTCHELLVAVKGSLNAYVDGHSYVLDNPLEGLFVPIGKQVSMDWFSKDCVLLVLASEHYDQYNHTYHTVYEVEAPAWAGA